VGEEGEGAWGGVEGEVMRWSFLGLDFFVRGTRDIVYRLEDG
jgi:hypothetical protein